MFQRICAYTFNNPPTSKPATACTATTTHEGNKYSQIRSSFGYNLK
jgi:hypothetical protein